MNLFTIITHSLVRLTTFISGMRESVCIMYVATSPKIDVRVNGFCGGQAASGPRQTTHCQLKQNVTETLMSTEHTPGAESERESQ
jgi:hypothetical protein